ncbi:unnamed protein product [Polarella glacialis]|uniref:Uncharacterized protein n=1 Tax=Polarella glacialis TaxID=89957 RepID=A0A813GSY7_POLGL|nr:unnamed protein product [Polarella glacialis]CAE8629718.1 unnamed protein product [Polarella glacialis]
MVVNKLKPPAAVSTASWLSGRQTVVPDSSCAMTITTELAYQKWSSFSKGSLERVTNPVLNCYCRQNPELRIPPYDTKEKEICQDWSYEENFKVGRIVGGTFAVIILNQLILMVYEVLVAWERHCTVTEVAQSQLLKLFLSQFVNTGMLVLLVNAELKEIPAWFVPFRVLQIGTGKYDDFNGEWYVAIGSGICLTIFIQVFSTTVPPLVKSFCVQPILARFFGRSQVIQDRMDKIYTLPDWNISLRLAQTLNVMFVITMYSSGLPILYFVGFVYCIVAFWMDKWCLLHGSSKPPAFNQSIIKTTLHLFPLAAFLHTIVACWTFGNQRLFPSPWSRLLPLAEMIFGMDEQTYNETIEAYLNANEEVKSLTQGKYFRARTVDFARDGCWLLLLIFLVFCAYYLIYWVLKIFLKPFVAPFMFAVKDCCCKKNKHAGDTTLEWKDCVRKSNFAAMSFHVCLLQVVVPFLCIVVAFLSISC